MSDRLSALDATFLELEQLDEGATMHIGSVMVFDALPDGSVPSLSALRDHLAVRLRQLPRYAQRLSTERTGGLGWPRWEDDPRYDIANHVGAAALPSPGGERELMEWAGEYFSHRLDRTRPLWEMTQLVGLTDGRWALATKTHHALVDGVGSVGVAEVLLDAAPGAPTKSQAPPVRPLTAFWETLLPRPPDALADLASTGAHLVSAAARVTLHPRDALARSRALLELIVADEVTPSPRTSFNVPIGSTRRYAVVRTTLAELKAIGSELGGSVNDVVLAACAAGLRRLMLARSEHPPRAGVRAMVPVNLRPRPERLALGNRISSLFVTLPVAEGDPLARLRRTVANTAALKSSSAAIGASTMLDLAALAPPVLHALIARSLYATRLFNITITNVPGPAGPLYALGAPMRELYPLVPLAAEHAVGIAIVSYAGRVALGVSADRASVPDLDVLVAGIEEGFDELHTRIPRRRGSAKPRRNAARAARSSARRARPVG